jgi:hypothetical protein
LSRRRVFLCLNVYSSARIASRYASCYNNLASSSSIGEAAEPISREQIDYLTAIPDDLLRTILEALPLEEIPSAFSASPRIANILKQSSMLAGWNSTAFSSFYRVSRSADPEHSPFRLWFNQKLLDTCIVPSDKLFADISSRIARKDRDFVTESTSLSGWDVTLRAKPSLFGFLRKSNLGYKWELVYRATLLGFGESAFHQACNGKGNYVVVVKAMNGRIAVAYNEDGFDHYSTAPNQNGFIVSINDDGSIGAQFDRSESEVGWDLDGIWDDVSDYEVFEIVVTENAFGVKGDGI